MDAIVEFLIGLFESLGLYSDQNGLGDHLRGLDLQCLDYSQQSIYSVLFLYLFAINSLIIINYYYGLFNRVPMNKWGWWFVNVLIGAFALFCIAYFNTKNDLDPINYCKNLKITLGDCYGFGATAAIYSFLYCIILSYIIKWRSNVNKTVNPFYFF